MKAGQEGATERAQAKINLYLHVGAIRRDGLHELASLFVFAQDGDIIRARPAAALSLEIVGPFAPLLSSFPVESNLVLRAARALQRAAGVKAGATLILEKRLPIASGIGGGSADAAATLRALQKIWGLQIDACSLNALAFSLGADVPACLHGAPVYVSGAGERIEPGPSLPPLWVCLVNPGVDMPTGPIFRDFDRALPDPPAPAFPKPRRLVSYEQVREFLRASNNDLERFATRRAPQIGAVRNFLAERHGAIGARMSGSGATVFGLFQDGESASKAACAARGHGWWSMATALARGGVEAR